MTQIWTMTIEGNTYKLLLEATFENRRLRIESNYNDKGEAAGTHLKIKQSESRCPRPACNELSCTSAACDPLSAIPLYDRPPEFLQ